MVRTLKVLGVLLTLAICTVVAVIGYYSFLEDRLATRFENVSLGSEKQVVFEQFGEPVSVSDDDCYVAQYIEYETPARWSTERRASSCAFWSGPIAKTYVVGFSVDGKVVGIAYGDS